MNDFKFVSEAYSKHHSKNYRLSIQINPDGFSALMTGEENKILQILHYQTKSIENTRKLFRSDENLVNFRELKFQSISLLINTSLCSLLPSSEEVYTNPSLLADLDFGTSPEDRVICMKLESLGVSLCYILQPNIKGFVSDFHNHPRIEHLTSRFLHFFPNGISSDFLNIYTTPGLLHIALRNGNVLKFHNIFSCQSNEEILYHLMNSLRNLDFSTTGDIFYSGHFYKKEPTWKLMNTYLPGLRELPNELPFDLAWDTGENYFHYLISATGEDHQW